jgi:hypothetical protein
MDSVSVFRCNLLASGDSEELYLLSLNEYVPLEAGDRIQYLKRCVLNKR